MRQHAQGEELFKCSCCRGWHPSTTYERDRHGIRRKTCNVCKVKRGGIYYLFLRGAAEKYGLTLEDLDEYIYVGNDETAAGIHYFEVKCPGEEAPEHTTQCVCDHEIIHNHYIRRMETGHTLVIGSCCKKRFITHGGKTCQDCGKPHKNRKVDRCQECRIGKCDSCGKSIDQRYKECFSCKHEKPTTPPTTIVETSKPPQLGTCNCGAMCKPNIFADNTTICPSCWSSWMLMWEARFPRVGPSLTSKPDPQPEAPEPQPQGLTDDDLAELLGFTL